MNDKQLSYARILNSFTSCIVLFVTNAQQLRPQNHKPKLTLIMLACVLFLSSFYCASLGIMDMFRVNSAFISGIQTVGTVTQVSTLHESSFTGNQYSYQIKYTDRAGNMQIGVGTDARPYMQGQEIPIAYNPNILQTVYHEDAYLYWISYGALYVVLALVLSLFAWRALLAIYPKTQGIGVLLNNLRRLNAVGLVLAIMLTLVSHLSGRLWF